MVMISDENIGKLGIVFCAEMEIGFLCRKKIGATLVQHLNVITTSQYINYHLLLSMK
ncbi:MAG: hypothetical protein HRT90_09210 [Candidatus Margulisbacteria bacterium]|nr:hypothetical protein [Candidatus Margulisiibacteriota bacterium]